MGVIFRFTLRSIREKKFRTFLILFSIMMSSALFFASGAMSGSVEKIIVDRIRNSVGTSEISVYPNEKSPSRYVTTAGVQRFSTDMEYIVGVVEGIGVYEHNQKETVKINLHGYDIDELQQMNPVYLEKNYSLYPFSGKKIIINSTTASKYGFNPGDPVEIEINKVKYRFVVSGIAAPKGIFLEDGRNEMP
ncbi:MAG: ABC transporter permease [Caulobacteraceae bacterium]